jgi:non-ribosomal peptide synthetase component F
VLARVRAASLDALDLQDLPFEEFVRRVRPDRQGSHTPLHRVLFNFVNAPPLRLDLTGARVELDTPPAQAAAKYELHWVFVDTGDALTGLLEYDRGLFDARSAARMADDCVRLLEVFVDAPDRTLDGLDLMTAGQESLALAFNEPL